MGLQIYRHRTRRGRHCICPFGADTWFGDRCCVSGALQEPRRDARGAGHVRCRMPRPDAAPGCVGRQELCHRVGDLPSSPRRSPCQGGQRRSAARGHHAVLEPQRYDTAFARRRLAFACADCMSTNSLAVQGRVRSSARTRAARCRRPTARSTPSRAQPAAQSCCGTVERTAVRAGGRPAGVSPLAARLRVVSTNI